MVIDCLRWLLLLTKKIICFVNHQQRGCLLDSCTRAGEDRRGDIGERTPGSQMGDRFEKKRGALRMGIRKEK